MATYSWALPSFQFAWWKSLITQDWDNSTSLRLYCGHFPATSLVVQTLTQGSQVYVYGTQLCWGVICSPPPELGEQRKSYCVNWQSSHLDSSVELAIQRKVNFVLVKVGFIPTMIGAYMLAIITQNAFKSSLRKMHYPHFRKNDWGMGHKGKYSRYMSKWAVSPAASEMCIIALIQMVRICFS